jgi:hypothetical protein
VSGYDLTFNHWMEKMNKEERIDIAARAMWRHRAREPELSAWGKMSWEEFQIEKADIAQIYLDNARAAVTALDAAAVV